MWIQTRWVNHLLMAVMLGMGLTIRPRDFKMVFTRPEDIAVGCAAQFTIMPLLAYLLIIGFGLEAGPMAGVVLAGTQFPSMQMATVPGAVFSVWHNISEAVLAAWYTRREPADGGRIDDIVPH